MIKPIQQRSLLPRLLLLACLLSAAGCGLGNRYIFASSPVIIATPERDGLAFEDVWFTTADGVRLNGWFVPGDAGKPLVLFFHGNAANISHRVENLHHLHGMGFPVFIFDYRGFGRSRGVPTCENDLWLDARAALAWLGRRGWEPGRMIYFGRSMGAAIATQMALEAPPAGIILEAPFTTLAEIARQTTPVTYALFGWWSLDAAFDNLNRVGRLRSPLLIFHGDGDTVVPPEMSRRLFARARAPKTLVILQGAGHSDAYAAGGAEYRRTWLSFAASLPSSEVAAARAKP